MLKLLDKSSTVYEVNADDQVDPDVFLKSESERFAKELQLTGENVVNCSETKDLIGLLRCKRPQDVDFDRVRSVAAQEDLKIRELRWRPRGSVQHKPDQVVVVIAGEGPNWLSYFFGKAAWRHEPSLRKNMDGPEDARASLTEEHYTLLVQAGGYLNSQEPSEGQQQKFQKDPTLEALVEAIEAGQLRGFALYEVIHVAYGIPLDALSPQDAKVLEAYLRSQVLEKAH